MKKILYLSVHEILEYDELLLFKELGHECYSLGAYTMPGGQENRKRPPLELPYNPHFIELAMQYPKEALHPEQLEDMDIVVIMHEPKFIENNWTLFKSFIDNGGRVIWRSIGQSIPQVERRLAPFRSQGLEVVRYSPAEMTIKDNIGCDAMIRFYKDPDEFNEWTGNDRTVINFTQSLKQRAEHTGYNSLLQVFQGQDGKVYGPGNEELGDLSGGLVSYDDQKRILRDSRVYFYTGTFPASYTLSFIEAMMTGIPMVCVGRGLGNGSMFRDQQTYEIPDIIEFGVNGYISDDIELLREAVRLLMQDWQFAKGIGTYGRKTAIDLFGKAKIKAEWQAYLTK